MPDAVSVGTPMVLANACSVNYDAVVPLRRDSVPTQPTPTRIHPIRIESAAPFEHRCHTPSVRSAASDHRAQRPTSTTVKETR